MTDPSRSSNIWDDRYSGTRYAFGERPNEWLTANAGRLAPRSKIFVPGDGEGRNGVWLARLGHDVETLDISEAGVRKALRLAAAHGVRIDARQGDLAQATWKPDRYDAIVSVFLHFEPTLRARVHAGLARSLAAGGLLIIEGFAVGQLGRGSGGPPSADMMFTQDILLVDFAPDLEAVLIEEAEVVLAEGPRHQGEAAVVHGVFRKTERSRPG